MFERPHTRLAPFRVFVARLFSYVGIALLMLLGALFIGIAGYHWIAGFGWIDAFLESSMILGGMGPVNPLASNSAKIFASLYALFSGVMFIGVMGIVISPIVHRLLHKFHLDDQTYDSGHQT